MRVVISARREGESAEKGEEKRERSGEMRSERERNTRRRGTGSARGGEKKGGRGRNRGGSVGQTVCTHGARAGIPPSANRID